jgi:hypothetical protein
MQFKKFYLERVGRKEVAIAECHSGPVCQKAGFDPESQIYLLLKFLLNVNWSLRKN